MAPTPASYKNNVAHNGKSENNVCILETETPILMTQNLSKKPALFLGVSKLKLMKSTFSEIWKELSDWCLNDDR